MLDERHRKPLLNATSFIYLNINGRIEVIIINHSFNHCKLRTCMFGSNFSPLLPNFVRLFLLNALFSPALVMLIPWYRFASIRWLSHLSLMSGKTTSSARDRFSDVLRRLLQ